MFRQFRFLDKDEILNMHMWLFLLSYYNFFVKMLSRKNRFGVVNFINYTQHKEIATDIDKVQGNRYIFSLLYPIYYKGIAA